MNRLNQFKEAVSPKLRRGTEFLASQGITTAANLLYGFFCLRILPVPEYAQYVVVFGFLPALTLLMDVNFSSSLLPLIGDRIDDRKLIADYVASLRQLAHWLFFAVTPVAVVAFPFMIRRQHWGLKTIAMMVAILLVAGWFARVSGAYGAVLIVRRDRTVWYRVQIASSLGTLALLGVFWSLHWLSALSAILINVAGMASNATGYYLRARRLLGTTGTSSPRMRKEIVHLASPNLPYSVFSAFQGQVSLFLIAFFGKTHSVASLGALTRLLQVYALLGQMGPLLIEPYFARLSKDRVLRSYFIVVVTIVLVCSVLTGLAYEFPWVFLWVLGPKYAGLHFEVVLIVALGGITYVNAMIGIINNARKFVYWWNGISLIVATLIVQTTFIMREDLSSVRGVLIMTIATVSSWLGVCVLTSVYGFVFGPRVFVDPSGRGSNPPAMMEVSEAVVSE